MSSGARIGLVLGTLVVLVLAFVALSPSADDESSTADAPTAPVVTQTVPGQNDAPSAQPVQPPPPPAPAFTTIRVKAGKPVGGLKTIGLQKGDRARIRVTSPDTSDEIHLHGYDKYADVAPGRSASFSFEANAEGIFEIELHGSGTQIAKLVVEP